MNIDTEDKITNIAFIVLTFLVSLDVALLIAYIILLFL